MKNTSVTQLVEDSTFSDCDQDDTTQTLSQGTRVRNRIPKGKSRIIEENSDLSGSDEEEEVGLTQQTAPDSEVDYVSDEDDEDSHPEYDYDSIEVGNYTKTRSEKDILVAKLLCRWWYVLPDWPPANYNYHEKLEANKLKCYSVKDFEDHENVDSNGYRKCYQISAFPGVFRDFKGAAYDLRPEEGKPCYNNLVQKSEKELVELIKIAIKKQMSLLSTSQYDESSLIKSLQKELAEL